MSEIRIETSDWLYNAGIVGVYNMLQYANKPVTQKSNAIIFEEESLDNFAEMYFGYLIKKYKKFTSWHKIVSSKDRVEGFNVETFTEKELTEFNNLIDYIKDKCKSNSYKSAYPLIKNIEFDAMEKTKQLTKVKLKKAQPLSEVWPDIEDKIKLYLEVVQYFEQPEVSRVIGAKNVIYDIVQKFWENVSFLNKQANKQDMYALADADFKNGVITYLATSHEKDKYQCVQCNRPISKLSKPAAYDLTWLLKVGVDMGRKSSHFWDLTADSYICPICNLVYACIPLGFTIMRGQGLFINENSSASKLIRSNKLPLGQAKYIDELEQESYYKLIDLVTDAEHKQSHKQINNIQIVRYNSNNTQRPYTFNVLSKDKLLKLAKVKKQLGQILNVRIKGIKDEYLNVYYEVVQNIYNNRNQFGLIERLLHLLLQGNMRNTYSIYNVLMINNEFIRGGGKMYYKEIDECRRYGVELRNFYIRNKAENKIAGISHQLLNSLKTKNSARFTDTLLHSYMYVKQAVPKVFIEALKSDEKLQTVGYAFLLGLQGETLAKTTSEEE